MFVIIKMVFMVIAEKRLFSRQSGIPYII
jgi:hypothetical protein